MPTETLLSPGVLLQETDKSFIPQGTDPSGLAIIGPTAKGPVDLPTQINNYGEFRAIFGTTIRNGTQKEEYFTHLAVKNYFENGGSSAIVTRVASGSWSTATNTPISSGTGAITGQVKSDAGSTLTIDTNVAGADEATLTDLATTSTDSGTGLTLDLTIDSGGTVTAIAVNQQGSGYTTGVITVSNTLIPGTGDDLVLDALEAEDIEDVATTAPFQLKTIGQGTVFNNSADTSTVPTKEDNGTYETSSKDAVKWEIKDINNAQGTFSLIVRRGDDTDNAPIILEQFTECSLDPLSSNYIARKIGDMDRSATLDASTGDYLVTDTGEFDNKSKYIRVSAVNLPTYQYINNAGGVGEDSSDVSYSGSLPIVGFGGFAGATGDVLSTVGTENRFGSASSRDVDDIQGLSTSSYDKAISLLKNKDEYKFNTLVVPGLNQSVHAGTIDTIITNTTQRGDSLFVADLEPYGASTAEVTAEAADIDSSFATSYWPWVQVFSSELNKNIWCPASTIIPGVYSKNDSIAAPWFAPAGETRGKVGRLVTGVEKKLSKATRDTLYSNKVNPIVSFRNSGILVFGQKTLQADKSALDRVNVRRLLLTVKQRIGAMADSVLFEQNTEATRQSFLQEATPYLENLVQKQGLYAFRIVMDDSNNTPDVIDNNQLVGQVFLQPTKTAEFVVIDFVLTRTGASFTD
jgi:hypothetical protein